MSLLVVILGLFGLLMFISFLLEAIVEAVLGQVFNKVPILTPYKWLLIYVAYAAGILGAFIFQFDLIYLVAKYLEISEISIYLSMPDIGITIYGKILTGFCIGRGSNFLHTAYSFFYQKVIALRDSNGNLNELTTPLLPLIDSTAEQGK